MHPTQVADSGKVHIERAGTAHPTADQGLRRFARVNCGLL